MIGRTIKHYRIQAQLGAGGMGVVFRARDEKLNRDVAIKVLPAGLLNDDHARRRFRKEAETLSQLNHPNIAVIHDFDSHEGADYLVMEFIPGASLDQRLAGGPMAEKDILAVVAQVAAALEEAHEHGIIHRDLKPGNVMLTPKGYVKVLDFGLAQLNKPVELPDKTASITALNAVSGTVPYMSPEQLLAKEVDARTDVYGLGVLLFEMATGQKPFRDDIPTRLLDKIIHQEPASPRSLNPQISAELEGIILKCLEKEPGQRYASAREVEEELRRQGLLSSASGLRAIVDASQRKARRWLAPGIVAVLVVALFLLIAVKNLRTPVSTPGGAIRSLAVLPLANLSGDPQQEFFADGMTDAIVAELAQIQALKVISRTSVMQYKGTTKKLPQVARELGVDAIVEGSVVRAGDRVRITAQLIDGRTDTHIWARDYERDLRDVLTLQREVAEAIAGEIRITLTPAERARFGTRAAVNPEVYQLYLRGRFHWNQRTEEGFQKALEHFRQAIELDPQYAPAYAGIADCHSLMVNYFLATPQEAFPKAKLAARKAIELDESLAEAHASLAFALHHFDWDWAGAEREYLRAVALNPGQPTAHQWYAELLVTTRRFDQAIVEMKRARELDPLSLVMNSNTGRIYYWAGRFDDAVRELRSTLELDPNYVWAHVYLGLALTEKGEQAEALRHLETSSKLFGGGPAVGHGYLYARMGRRADAEKVLAALRGNPAGETQNLFFIAGIHAALGNRDKAFAALDRAFQQHSFFLVFLDVNPAFQPLRGDPRFAALLKRMNYPSVQN
jgi:serine/threonine-protein kinase